MWMSFNISCQLKRQSAGVDRLCEVSHAAHILGGLAAFRRVMAADGHDGYFGSFAVALELADQAEAVAEPAPPQQQIEFVCSYCDAKVQVNAELAGKQTSCPECRRIVKVPLLEKQGPKDWRKVDARRPVGARPEIGPAPEGTWDARSVGTVSREALEEAEAIPQVKKRLTWQQWTKRAVAAAAVLAVVGLATWTIFGWRAQAQQTRMLALALEDADKTVGLEAMCVGGGQGMAMIVERL